MPRGKSSKKHQSKSVKFIEIEKPVERDENEPSANPIIRSTAINPTTNSQVISDLKSEIDRVLRELCWRDYFERISNIKDPELISACCQYISNHPDTHFFGDVAIKACQMNFTYSPVENEEVNLQKFVADFVSKFETDYSKIYENLDHIFDQREDIKIWEFVNIPKKVLVRDLAAKFQIYDSSCRYEDDKLTKIIHGFEEIINIIKEENLNYNEIKETTPEKDFDEMKKDWFNHFFAEEKQRQEKNEEAELAAQTLHMLQQFEPTSYTPTPFTTHSESLMSQSLTTIPFTTPLDVISFSDVQSFSDAGASIEMENGETRKRTADKENNGDLVIKKSKWDDMQQKLTDYEQMQETWKSKLEERIIKLEEEQKKEAVKNSIIKMSNVFAKGFNSVTENQLRGHAEMTKLQHELQKNATKSIIESLKKVSEPVQSPSAILMPPPPPPSQQKQQQPQPSSSSELSFSLKTKKNLDNLKMLEKKPLGDLRDVLSTDLTYTPRIKNLLVKMNEERSLEENEKDMTFWLFVALKK